MVPPRGLGLRRGGPLNGPLHDTPVAALHGLILALVFAQNLFSYQEIRTSLVREATAIADIFYDFGRYGADNADAMQAEILEYIRLVKEEEFE